MSQKTVCVQCDFKPIQTSWGHWRRYTKSRQVKWPSWKIHRLAPYPRSAYCFASVIVWTENKNVTICLYDGFICFILTVKRRWRPVFWLWATLKGCLFLRIKVHPGNLAGGFSDLEMIWLLYCAGAATGWGRRIMARALNHERPPCCQKSSGLQRRRGPMQPSPCTAVTWCCRRQCCSKEYT